MEITLVHSTHYQVNSTQYIIRTRESSKIAKSLQSFGLPKHARQGAEVHLLRSEVICPTA